MSHIVAAFDGLVVSVLAMGPTVAFSAPAEDAVIKIHSAHFLRRGSKAIGPVS
jgi:hypothetical protein